MTVVSTNNNRSLQDVHAQRWYCNLYYINRHSTLLYNTTTENSKSLYASTITTSQL